MGPEGLTGRNGSVVLPGKKGPLDIQECKDFQVIKDLMGYKECKEYQDLKEIAEIQG